MSRVRVEIGWQGSEDPGHDGDQITRVMDFVHSLPVRDAEMVAHLGTGDPEPVVPTDEQVEHVREAVYGPGLMLRSKMHLAFLRKVIAAWEEVRGNG